MHRHLVFSVPMNHHHEQKTQLSGPFKIVLLLVASQQDQRSILFYIRKTNIRRQRRWPGGRISNVNGLVEVMIRFPWCPAILQAVLVGRSFIQITVSRTYIYTNHRVADVHLNHRVPDVHLHKSPFPGRAFTQRIVSRTYIYTPHHVPDVHIYICHRW
jgi:hypothetical protein